MKTRSIKRVRVLGAPLVELGHDTTLLPEHYDFAVENTLIWIRRKRDGLEVGVGLQHVALLYGHEP